MCGDSMRSSVPGPAVDVGVFLLLYRGVFIFPSFIAREYTCLQKRAAAFSVLTPLLPHRAGETSVSG